MRPRISLTVFATVATVLAVPGATNARAAVADSCTYRSSDKTVLLHATDFLTLAVGRQGSAIVGNVDGTVLTCGAATVTDTAQILMSGQGGSFDTFYANFIKIDESGGRLGPGAGVESTGVSEIEIAIDVQPGANVLPPYGLLPLELLYVGGSRGDKVTLGATGVDLAGDGDRDVTTTTPFGGAVFYGQGGSDTLSGNGNAATGGRFAQPLTMDGGDGADKLTGGAAGDQLTGGAGNDILNGGLGSDQLTGDTGDDQLNGGKGDETFALGSDPGADTVSGGPGTDTADYSGAASGVTVSLDGLANDGLPGEGDNVGPAGDIERLVGSPWDDQLTGSPNADTLVGGDGQDEIFAMGGDDTIDAVDHLKDIIDGGDGTDTASIDRYDSVANVEVFP